MQRHAMAIDEASSDHSTSAITHHWHVRVPAPSQLCRRRCLVRVAQPELLVSSSHLGRYEWVNRTARWSKAVASIQRVLHLLAAVLCASRCIDCSAQVLPPPGSYLPQRYILFSTRLPFTGSVARSYLSDDVVS